EVAIGSALIPVIASHNFHARVGPAHAQRCLASVAAVCAHSADVLHFPRTRLVPIGSRGERTHRTDVDAHPAFFAFQMIFFIRSDQRTHAAVLHSEGPHIHALAADAHAAKAQNATWPVEEHHRRPLL